jgi:hypothetical protein
LNIFVKGHFYRKTSLIILALVTGFFLLGVWMVLPPSPLGFDWDDTWFAWYAEWLSGRNEHLHVAWTMLQSRQYPPLFPFALSLTGQVLVDHSNALILNVAFLALATGVAMTWFFREGMPITAMVFAGALMMFNPLALTFLPALMSEPLFILLTSVVLLLANLNRQTRLLWLLIGFTTGLAVATRSAGWALVAALIGCLVFQRRFLLLIPFLPGLAAGLAIIVYLRAGLPGIRGYSDDLVNNLSTLHWGYLVQHLRSVLRGWVQIWGSTTGTVIATVLVSAGLVVRFIRFRIDAWYAVASFCMLMVWPYPDQMSRFIAVLMPVFLMAIHTVSGLLNNEKYRSIVSSAALVLIFVLSVPHGLGRSLERLMNPPEGELAKLSSMHDWTRSVTRQDGLVTLKVRQQFLADMALVSTWVDNSQCVYSEYSALVSSQVLVVSYASPWNSLDELVPEMLACSYYYLVPDALPGTTIADVERFALNHEELFRSRAPYGEPGTTVFGVFLKLNSRGSKKP